MNLTLDDIAHHVQGTLIGSSTMTISTLCAIDAIKPGSLVFAEGRDNLICAEQSSAAAILVSHTVTQSTKPLIQVTHPLQAFIQLLNLFYPEKRPTPDIHPTAIIADDVSIGARVTIGAYVSIGSGSVIGDDCILHPHVCIGQHVVLGEHSTLFPHVTVYDKSQIGHHVRIHANSVIGADGFGYTALEGKHLKIPHVGCVVLGNHVEIGANSVIDRATLGETYIGEGTKIDNFVQVAHSVKLGKHNILCAFTGIAGSSQSGDNVIFAANVGVSDHVKIDDNVILGARAGVPPRKHLLQNNIYLGNPARPKQKALQQELAVTRIPLMSKTLRALGDKLKALTTRVEQYEQESKSS
ncbi:MAG: UDP-3-O-(3-hydroxymyristoyl)glucosamine N-acyltransferase [Legionellaceae bacterium]|nr:UDP-3-O-(3-hydroxymyristoyl)glucosamine N-acyltransferase [Legionellaceae bacterium]HAF87187.1 UDP-3-O-(3-hydroxymyristoyl)glucosamine N-acyltransferase [Legionellales bacterium]HCA89933.1 UDP-3-O-(3-hydroxymyristoyl)glucosamine N-acyltransferase [Legionellales bacterium]|tara:strand:+ start:3218 stop:4279 length:1062 start_codon:yes stop_codon:yes gene_type:complete